MTLEELKALYAEKGATEAVHGVSEQGDTVDYQPIQYGQGWTAWDKAPEIIGYQDGAGGGEGGDQPVPIYSTDKKLGGFAKQEGDYITSYDLDGNVVKREKWNYNMLKQNIKDLGPLVMAAMTMGGGNALLGEALGFGTGAASAGVGGALAGGVNAYGNDSNILKGALLGGISGAGAQEIGKIGDTSVKLGDVTKAINFAQNPTLAGAAGVASPYMPNLNVGDSGISLNDILKGAGTAKALGSGDYNQIFKAITSMAGDQGKSLKSSLSGFDANPDDFIEGYFKPGGEGYNALMAGDTTVLEDPQNLDAFLRSISPYAADGGTSVFKQAEDIPEMETVAKRPKSLMDILGTPDILQTVAEDVPELTITGDRPKSELNSLRTKDIKSDIPDVITPDQIDKLKFDTKIDDILKTVTPITKVVTPTVTPATTTAKSPTTQQLMSNLGLNAPNPSQDPYANIKLMEELFGGDISYKLRALNSNQAQNSASADTDALARLLRG